MTDAALPAGIARLVGPDGVVQRVRPAAYAWCEQGGALLLCRVAGQGPGGGQWTLPGGGLRFGEEPLGALVREVREETGLDVAPGELLGVHSAIIEPADTVTGHRIQTLGVVWRVTVAGGQLRDELDGSTDRARWIPGPDVDRLPLTPMARWAIELVRGA
jgi:8-oxo-dGTP diphosphatase